MVLYSRPYIFHRSDLDECQVGSTVIIFGEHCRLRVNRSEVYDHTNALPRCGDRRDRRGIYLELDPLDFDKLMLLNHLRKKIQKIKYGISNTDTYPMPMENEHCLNCTSVCG